MSINKHDGNPDESDLTHEKLAQLIITSREKAEIFITLFIECRQGPRTAALKRLRELGIYISKLP